MSDEVYERCFNSIDPSALAQFERETLGALQPHGAAPDEDEFDQFDVFTPRTLRDITQIEHRLSHQQPPRPAKPAPIPANLPPPVKPPRTTAKPKPAAPPLQPLDRTRALLPKPLPHPASDPYGLDTVLTQRTVASWNQAEKTFEERRAAERAQKADQTSSKPGPAKPLEDRSKPARRTATPPPAQPQAAARVPARHEPAPQRRITPAPLPPLPPARPARSPSSALDEDEVFALLRAERMVDAAPQAPAKKRRLTSPPDVPSPPKRAPYKKRKIVCSSSSPFPSPLPEKQPPKPKPRGRRRSRGVRQHPGSPKSQPSPAITLTPKRRKRARTSAPREPRGSRKPQRVRRAATASRFVDSMAASAARETPGDEADDVERSSDVEFISAGPAPASPCREHAMFLQGLMTQRLGGSGPAFSRPPVRPGQYRFASPARLQRPPSSDLAERGSQRSEYQEDSFLVADSDDPAVGEHGGGEEVDCDEAEGEAEEEDL